MHLMQQHEKSYGNNTRLSEWLYYNNTLESENK